MIFWTLWTVVPSSWRPGPPKEQEENKEDMWEESTERQYGDNSANSGSEEKYPKRISDKCESFISVGLGNDDEERRIRSYFIIPGYEKDDISVTVADGCVFVKGKKQWKKDVDNDLKFDVAGYDVFEDLKCKEEFSKKIAVYGLDKNDVVRVTMEGGILEIRAYPGKPDHRKDKVGGKKVEIR